MNVKGVGASRQDDFTSVEADRQPVRLRQPASNSSDDLCVTAVEKGWSRLPTPEPMAPHDIVIGRRVATTRSATTMRYEASLANSAACQKPTLSDAR